MTRPDDALRAALAALLPGHALEAAERHGRGHIHDTYVATCRGADGVRARWLVQRVNTHVFGDPDALARNLERVTRHLRAALRARGVADAERRSLAPVAGRDGATLQRDAEGRPWRAFPFIERTRSLAAPESPAQAGAAARAFGAFVADLADLPPDEIAETIPHFHDLASRVDALARAESADAHGRAAGGADELAAARSFAARLAGPGDAALPRRVVHNDCKLDNLLLDAESGEALCVVDLDTVMPGLTWFDFGELVRTAACRAPEDETVPSRIRFEPALFAALVDGYVAGARGLLTGAEIDALARAGPRMALENAVRFLADHLDGDRYFRVARPGQNLDRARAQLRRVERMLDAEREIRAAIDPLARAAG
jgi:Ser/Thr protein kinase RdoA (MazF antagonist)